jgi:DNA-binding transcriptional regulator LsrR (DeoR family)
MPRPPKTPTTADMIKAATLFYKDELPRKEMADRLNTDLRGVKRLLDSARAQGIVSIQVHGTLTTDLEQQVRAKFPHIEKVLIAPGGVINTPDKHAELHQRWAFMAADYFDELYDNHPQGTPIHVGLSGGEHILEFVNAVPERRRENLYIHVTGLIGRGRLSEGGSHVEPFVNASILWSHSGRLPGRCEYATVSPYVNHRPGKASRAAVRTEIEKLEKNQAVAEVIKAMDKIDVAFVGIGIANTGRINPVSRNRVTMGSLLENIITTQQLAREKAIGDLAYSIFDAAGNSPKKWQFFLTAGHYSKYPGVEFYKRMVATGKKVVASGGPYKLDAIKVALKSKMFNVWITDEHTARELVKGS